MINMPVSVHINSDGEQRYASDIIYILLFS